MKQLVGIVALLATGAWLGLARAWTPELRVGLVAHIAIGIAVVPAVMKALFARLQRSVPQLTRATAGAALTFVVLAALLPYLEIPIGLPPLAGLLVALGLLVSGGVALRGMREWVGEVRWDPRLVLELLHALLWALATATGPAMVLTGGGRDVQMLFTLHGVAGFTMVVLSLLLVLRIGVARLGAGRGLGGADAAVVIGALVLLAMALLEHRVRVPEHVLHLSAIPWSERPAEQRDPLPLPVDPELISLERSCGAADGCHAGILSDHARSPHERSMQTAHMQRNLDLLVAETGAENVTTCAGCHDARGLVETAPVGDGRDAHDGLGCVLCHAITEVEIGEDRLRTRVTLRIDERALEAFRDAERSGALGRLTRLGLDLTADAHGRSLSPAVLGTDAFCLACHAAQIEPEPDAPSCVSCHMPPRSHLGLAAEGDPEADAKSHAFPGTNAMLPYLLDDPERVELVADWAASRMLTEEFPHDAYRLIPLGQPPIGADRLPGFFYLRSEVRAESDPVPGAPWPIAIHTESLSVHHRFPAGPMDLLEMWLELTVEDDQGRVIFESGVPGPAGRLPEGTRTMGGHAIDASGAPIERYRVWRMVGEVVERALEPGEAEVDRFVVPLPERLSGDLTVRARWRYRELDHAFLEWAYPEGAPSLPAIEVSRAFAQFPVRP